MKSLASLALVSCLTGLLAATVANAAAVCTGSANISSARAVVDSSPVTLIPGESGTCADGKYIYLVGNDGSGNNMIRRVAPDGTITPITEAAGLAKGGPSTDQYFTYCDVFASGDMFLRYGTDNPELWMTNVAWFDELGELISGDELGALATASDTWNPTSATHPEVCDPDASGDNGEDLRWYGALGNLAQDPETGSLYVISHFCKSIYRIEISLPGLCCGGPPPGPPAFSRHMRTQCQCLDDGGRGFFPMYRRMATQCGGGGGPSSRVMQLQCGGGGGPEYKKFIAQRRKQATQGRAMKEQDLPDTPFFAFRVGGQIKNAGTDDDANDAFNAKLNEARHSAFFGGKLYFLDTSGLRVFDPNANERDGSITTLANSPGLSGFNEGLNAAANLRFSSSTSYHLMSSSTLVILDSANHALWGVELSDVSNLNFGLLLPSDGSSSTTNLGSPTLIHPMGTESFVVADSNGIRIVESVYPGMCYESTSTTSVGTISTKMLPPGPPPAARHLNVQQWVKSEREKRRRTKGTKKGEQRRALATQSGPDPEEFAMCTDGTNLYMANSAVMKISDPTDMGSAVPLVSDFVGMDGQELISHCDIHGDTMYVSWDGGSVLGRMSLAGGDTGIALISAYDFDYWGSNGELGDNTRCDGGFDGDIKTFGGVGNLIATSGMTRFFLFGPECGVLWEYSIFMTFVEAWIVGGMSTATDAGGPGAPALDSSDPTTARLKGARYGAYHQGSRGDQGRILFLDESGLRKYTLGGGITTLTASSPTWSNTGYTAGLNSVASMPLSAGLSATKWSQLLIREGNMLYISDPVSHAVWAGDVSDDQSNILWGPVIGGYPTALGAGTTDGPAATGQLDSIIEMMNFQDGILLLDNTGIRFITGRPSKCAGDVIPAVASAACTPATVCGVSQYESTPKGRYTDRVCSPLTVCGGSEYESTAPTATSNRVCTTLTVCGPSEVETSAPTATSDRVCSPAAAGTPAPPVPATPNPGTPATPPGPGSGSGSSASTTNTPDDVSGGTAVTTTTGSSVTTTANNNEAPTSTATTTAVSMTTTTITTATTTSTAAAAATDTTSSSSAAGGVGPADEVLIDPAAPPANNAVRTDGGLSGGEQAGISLGVILVIVGVCGVIGFALWKLKMSKKKDKDADLDSKEAPPPLSERAKIYTPQETSIFQENNANTEMEGMQLE